MRRLLLASLLATCAGFSGPAQALPSGFQRSLVTDGLDTPTAMAFAPDGRLFVCEQGGALRVVRNGVLLPDAALTVNTVPDGERGLLGVAFDPSFGTNQRVYVYYTAQSPDVHNRVSRFTLDGDTAVAGSEEPIVDLEPLSDATNHNGGAIHFDAQGFLFIAVGDNADGDNAQALTNRKGKILRVRADGGIPSDNPFFTRATGPSRSIWALGLRNPFTFDIERGTGRLFINDVGQDTWEEVNTGRAGANYGWPAAEGPNGGVRFQHPLFAYRHDGNPGGCAIAGGAFYRPAVQQFPAEFTGRYFFADLCAGYIRVLDPRTRTSSPFTGGLNEPVDLKVGPEGSLFALSHGDGAVYRFSFNAAAVPVLTSLTVSPTSVRGGRSATGTVRFDRAVPVTETVLLTSDRARLASVPARVRVRKGRRSAHFTIKTRRPAETVDVPLHARFGADTRDGTLTVRH